MEDTSKDQDKNTAFDTIEQFVLSLSQIYKEDKPLLVFNKFIQKIRNNELKDDYRELMLKSFNNFYTSHKQKISAGTIGELPRDACVTVTSGMKLNIPKYYTDADNNDRSNIAKTLLTIGCLLNPEDNEAFKLLEDFESKFRKLNVDSDSKEGAFVNSVVNLALSSVQNIDPKNPQANLANLGSALPQLMSELQNGMQSGEIDPQKMVEGFQGMIGTFSSLLPAAASDAADFLQNPAPAVPSVPADAPASENLPEQDVIPIVEPRGNGVMGSDGSLNLAGMMQMASGLMKQTTENSNNVSEIDDAATNSALFSSMAKTVGDTLTSAMSAASED